MQIGEDRLLHQIGMKRRHAVHTVAADKGQIGHPHPPFAILVDQADRRHRLIAHPVALAGFAKNAAVDGVDQLHVSGQQSLEQRQGPAFQRLGQQRVVGIAERLARDLPCLVERQVMVIDQQPHQFRNRNGRMGIVQLDRRLVRQRADVAEILHMASNDVLDRGRGEEILLPQPKLLAGRAAV